ncbi:MAG: N-acetyltransferase [Pseudomonadota bacterium]
MLTFELLNQASRDTIGALVRESFTASADETEGRLVGGLAESLALAIDDDEVVCVGALDSDVLAGVIFFSRLHFAEPVSVYLLSPVAVATRRQRSGVGQSLINAGIAELKRRAAAVVVTYGDPDYYSKTGFQPLSESVLQAPLPLSMPHGWLGQSLDAESVPALTGRPACLEAFDDPSLW